MRYSPTDYILAATIVAASVAVLGAVIATVLWAIAYIVGAGFSAGAGL